MALRNPYSDDYDRVDKDEAIRSTNDDAAISRQSAHLLGYIKDDYVGCFVHKHEQRSPLINRGTFLRFQVIQDYLRKFSGKQVVSLGAGSDTRKDEFIGNEYCLLAADLRTNWHNIVDRMKRCGFDETKPTLFLSECFLIYLEVKHSEEIVKYAASLCKSSFLVYEQILPFDAFGKTMIHNLKLHGIEKYPTLESQILRCKNAGFKQVEVNDMLTIANTKISKEEFERIDKIEKLDEVEEWHLLLKHYALIYAHNP